MVLVWYWCSAAKVHNFLWTDPLHWHILVLEKKVLPKKRAWQDSPTALLARDRRVVCPSVHPSVRLTMLERTFV